MKTKYVPQSFKNYLFEAKSTGLIIIFKQIVHYFKFQYLENVIIFFIFISRIWSFILSLQQNYFVIFS